MHPRRRYLYPVLVVGVVAVVVMYGLPLSQRPGIDRLTTQALSASSATDQIKAAQQLSQLGQPALAGMRRVMNESNNDDVVAISILGVSRQMDYESMDQILEKLGDPSATIRIAAAKATTKLLGRDHHFPVNGPLELRTRIKNQIAQDWQEYDGSALFEFNKNRFENENK